MVEVSQAEYQEWLYSHFEGGREGVRNRAIEQIKKGLEGISQEGLLTIQRDKRIPNGFFEKFQTGDYSQVNCSVVRALLFDHLGIELGEWIGFKDDIDFSSEVDKINDRMYEREEHMSGRYPALERSLGNGVSEEDRFASQAQGGKIFLALSALYQL